MTWEANDLRWEVLFLRNWSKWKWVYDWKWNKYLLISSENQFNYLKLKCIPMSCTLALYEEIMRNYIFGWKIYGEPCWAIKTWRVSWVNKQTHQAENHAEHFNTLPSHDKYNKLVFAVLFSSTKIAHFTRGFRKTVLLRCYSEREMRRLESVLQIWVQSLVQFCTIW